MKGITSALLELLIGLNTILLLMFELYYINKYLKR